MGFQSCESKRLIRVLPPCLLLHFPLPSQPAHERPVLACQLDYHIKADNVSAETLKALIGLLAALAQHHAKNGMSAIMLGQALGPLLFRPGQDDRALSSGDVGSWVDSAVCASCYAYFRVTCMQCAPTHDVVYHAVHDFAH